MEDPIVDEVRKAREQLARKFNYDIHAIFTDIRERQKSLGNRLVSPVTRTGQTRAADKAADG